MDQATLPRHFTELANAGFSVFPVPALTKTPQEWKIYQSQHANPLDVQRWANSLDNIGVATGAISGCFVLDLDNEKTHRWLADNRGLPATMTVKSPRGYHFYYRHPGWQVKNRANLKSRDEALPCGIDIRGDGGFAIGAGSYYVPTSEEAAKGKLEGAYRFLPGQDATTPIADAPAWLLDVIRDAPYIPQDFSDRPIPDAYVAAAIAGEVEAITIAPAGERNDQVNRSAHSIGQLVGANALDHNHARSVLYDAARFVGQGDSEAKATIESGLRAGMKKPRQMPAREDSVGRATLTPVVAPTSPEATKKAFGADAFRASDVANIEAPDQAWIIEDFVPQGHVTTLFGDGGVGKSLLVQTMASHIASGEPFVDRGTMKLPVAAIMCEDDASELNRRQRRINARLFDDAEVRDFTILSRIGEDNVLGTIGAGKWEPSKLYMEIEEWVIDRGIRVLIIDNIMQVFGGDINDNQSVTWFVNSLTRLARKMDGAVILLGHIAKLENSRFSGSMAWNNAVRARLFLSRVDTAPDQPMELRQLTVDKSNYGKAGLSVELALHNGVLIDKRSVSDAERESATMRSAKARAAVIALLEKEGSISMSHQSPAYIFAQHRLSILRRSAGAVCEKEIKIAVEAMLVAGTIRKETREWSDGAKKKRERIVLASATHATERSEPNDRLAALRASMKVAA